MSEATNEQDINAIEISIEDAKANIKMKDAFVRLQNNPDFKVVIEKGFLEKHAVRQVLLKAHPGMQDPAQQNLLDQQITSIGGLKQFLVSIYTQGMNAYVAMANDEATLEEIRAEELAAAEETEAGE